RATQLSGLADRALTILFQKTPPSAEELKPGTAIDVLVLAWITLAKGDQTRISSLAEIPEANRTRALEILADPVGRGNIQIIRLRYDLTCIGEPSAFKQQLDFVEQLQATNYRTSPQLRLEYAILLYQNARYLEGDKTFRLLRHLWRESEQFVEVPERLRWLRGPDGKTLRAVTAVIGSDSAIRAMALVKDF